jgi:hypothetical protein
VNIDYVQRLFIERVVRHADQLIKIEVLISEPELWFESEVERCGTPLPF